MQYTQSIQQYARGTRRQVATSMARLGVVLLEMKPTQSFPALLLQCPLLPRAVCSDLRQRTDHDGFHRSEDLPRSAPTSDVQPSAVNQLIWLVRGDVHRREVVHEYFQHFSLRFLEQRCGDYCRTWPNSVQANLTHAYSSAQE